MEGDENSGGRRTGELSDNPLLAQLVFVKMEDIMDKLKLLNYEADFCKTLKMKPFPKYVFRYTMLKSLVKRSCTKRKSP